MLLIPATGATLTSASLLPLAEGSRDAGRKTGPTEAPSTCMSTVDDGVDPN